MQRGNIIALGNIIRIAGDEHNLNSFIFAANLTRRRHTVHPAHFNIKKQDIESFILVITKKKAFRRRENLNLNLRTALFCPFKQKRLHECCIGFAVVAYCNAVFHTHTSEELRSHCIYCTKRSIIRKQPLFDIRKNYNGKYISRKEGAAPVPLLLRAFFRRP